MRRALTAYYGTPYAGGSGATLTGGFGKPAGKPVRIERDSQNRPVFTTARPSAPVPRRLS